MNSPIVLTYASALKKLFLDEKDFINFIREIKILDAIFQKEIFTFFCSPLVSSNIKKQLLKNSLQKTSLIMLNFLYVLIDKKQFYLWPDIVDQIKREELKINLIVVAKVESATKLAKSTVQQIKKNLRRFFNKSIQLREIISPDVIGGIKIQAEGIIFNDTISFHLSNIKRRSEMYGDTN